MNINAIIQYLDNYMLQRGMKQIGAVEANAESHCGMYWLLHKEKEVQMKT